MNIHCCVSALCLEHRRDLASHREEAETAALHRWTLRDAAVVTLDEYLQFDAYVVHDL